MSFKNTLFEKGTLHWPPITKKETRLLLILQPLATCFKTIKHPKGATTTTPDKMIVAEAKAEAKEAKDTANPVTVPEAPAPVKPTHQAAVAHDYSGVSIPARLRQRRAWWKRHAAPRIVDILDNGLLYHVHLPQCVSRALPLCPYDIASLENFHARKLVYEYEEIGAIRRCARSDVDYFFPWFVVLKEETTTLGAKIKAGSISNLRKPNTGIPISHFRMDQ